MLPVVIYMHGGGWVLGDRETHDRLLRELTNGIGAAVVFVDYERSPEARYPVAIEQGYAVAKYVADNAEKLGVDAGRMAVAGDSVGGNMAAVIALLAKERKGPAFRAQVLFYPVTDASMSTPSYTEFAEGPWLTRAAMAGSGTSTFPTPTGATKATPLRSMRRSKNLPACPRRCSSSTERRVARRRRDYGRARRSRRARHHGAL